GEDQKYRDEHIRDRSREVARELALHDGDHAVHAAAPPVIDRKTSSSRRDGTRPASPCGVSSARILPCAMMIARLHTASTSSSRCVEITMILLFAILPISSRTSCFWLGSRPSVGSSKISTSGSCTIACARPTRRL